MSGFSEMEPFHTTSFGTEVKANKTHYIPNTISLTKATISSTTVNNSSDSSPGNIDMLFTWVLIACVLLAFLMIVSVFLVIVYWRVKRRRSRTATVTDDRRGAGKERKRGRVNLRNSIKRVFVSEGPLYAVSNLSGSRYKGLPGRQNNSGNPDSVRSSPEPEIMPSDAPGHISQENQHVIYQRYLSPIEGVPPPTMSVPMVKREESDLTYLQPVDELRASKRFLQRSKNDSPEPEDTYLEPLHGLPVPDEVHPKTTTPKPTPQPKPTIKRKL